jgi:hypothetical protein
MLMPNAVELMWPKLHRLIPSHFPPIDLFEEVADPDDLAVIFDIEALTNDRLREEAGDLHLVPEDERISGQGSSPIMAAFTHIGRPSRFTDGQYGVYYGAKTLQTALKETAFHREAFLRATDEPDTELTMRCYVNQVCKAVHDIRGDTYPELYQADYQTPQAFGAQMRKEGSNGLVYDSVRDAGGECVAMFKPNALTPAVQAGHYKYVWRHKDNKIVDILSVAKVEFD